MVQGRDRRPELGFKLALECRKSIVYPIKNKNSKYNNTVNSEQEGSMANVNESNHNSVKVTQIMYVLQFYSDTLSQNYILQWVMKERYIKVHR